MSLFIAPSQPSFSLLPAPRLRSGLRLKGRRPARPSAEIPRLRISEPKPSLRETFYIGGYRCVEGRLTEILIGKKGKKGLRYLGSMDIAAVTGLRKKLHSYVRMLHVYDCPFAGAPENSLFGLTEEKMEECLWVEPSVKVWVEFDLWTESGHIPSGMVTRMVE